MELTTVIRQSDTTGIPFIAGEIRHGRMPSFPAYCGVMPGVFLVDTDEFSDEVERVWRELSRTGECLVLSTVKGGAAGIIGLNERLQSIAQDGRDVPNAGFLPLALSAIIGGTNSGRTFLVINSWH